METILLAIGIVLIIEGLGPFLFPNRWADYLAKMAKMPVRQLQQTGAMLLIIGCLFLWLS
ncbi:DUF2065 domain-containing protein [Saccharobesus litoralis]|nr:DUF2065 domain-containing protein [Saccharobesus litoralis]